MVDLGKVAGWEVSRIVEFGDGAQNLGECSLVCVAKRELVGRLIGFKEVFSDSSDIDPLSVLWRAIVPGVGYDVLD